jgi:hypothetical protein
MKLAAPIPLTPALSQRERENCPQVVGENEMESLPDGVCTSLSPGERENIRLS